MNLARSTMPAPSSASPWAELGALAQGLHASIRPQSSSNAALPVVPVTAPGFFSLATLKGHWHVATRQHLQVSWLDNHNRQTEWRDGHLWPFLDSLWSFGGLSWPLFTSLYQSTSPLFAALLCSCFAASSRLSLSLSLSPAARGSPTEACDLLCALCLVRRGSL